MSFIVGLVPKRRISWPVISAALNCQNVAAVFPEFFQVVQIQVCFVDVLAPFLLAVLEIDLKLSKGLVCQVAVCLSFRDHFLLNVLQVPRQLLFDATGTVILWYGRDYDHAA